MPATLERKPLAVNPAASVELWDHIAPVFGHQSGAWFKLMRLAAAYPNSLSAREVHGPHKLSSLRGLATKMRKWEAAGLVKITAAISDKHNHLPTLRYALTEKGAALLRLPPLPQ